MSWIEINDYHINMDQVRSFWWKREDAFTANLYLEYGNGEVIAFKDGWQLLYHRACQATGQKMIRGE